MSTAPDNLGRIGPDWNGWRVPLIGGTYDTRIKTGEDYESASLAELFTMEPDAKPKMEGPAFIPSSYADFDAREHSAQRERGQFIALTGDIDTDDHQLAKVESLVRGFTRDAAWLIYSSPHARPGNMRWRVVIPLSRSLSFDHWHDAQNAFFDFMEESGVEMDRALARAAQLVFLPNVPDTHEKSGTALRGDDGAPLYYQRSTSGTNAPGLTLNAGPIAAYVAAIRRQREADERERERIRKEAEARRANAPLREGAPIIEDFNRGTSIETLLELYGYERSPRHSEDWRSPNQTSESYATRVIGDKWISLSGSDVGARLGENFKGGCFGDAYDLFVHYEHGGDHKAAFRTLYGERRAANYAAPALPPVDQEDPGWTEPPEGPADEAEIVVEPVIDEASAEGLPLVDMRDWIGKSPPPRLFAWGDMIPLMTTTMLTGPGGVGKSLFEQMLCTCIALGIDHLGLPTRQMNTLYVTCEDDEEELWRRQAGICAALGVPLKTIIGKLHLASLCGHDGTALASFDGDGRMTLTVRWHQLVRTCEDGDIGLYAFDNATDAMAGDLNDIHQVAEFVNLLTGLAIRRGGAAMILHHPNKAGDDWLGSVAWHNKVRSRLIIKRSEEEGDIDGRVVENPKANYGASGGQIPFRWFKGAFIRDEDIPENQRAEMDDLIRANGAAERFLACLAKTLEQQRNVSHAPSAGNYAPRIFARMTAGKGYDMSDYEKAMERLLHTGDVIANERVFQYPNRSWAVGLGLHKAAQSLGSE